MRLSLRLLVYGLFLASGATALVYQVAWMRSLSLIFGASFEAISIVLGAFMAGLAVGGVYFGRISNHVQRPLRLYGYLELGVAVFALVLPLLLGLVNGAYVNIAQRVEGVNWAVTLMRTVMAFCVLVLPTFFMGGTLPVLVRFLVHRYGELAGRLSGLYAINTLGAVIGTVAAAFILLPALGVWRAQLVAVAGNVIVGITAILADRRVAAAGGSLRRQVSTEPKAEGDDPLTAGDTAPSHPWGLRLAFWGTAVAGMGALALEVMWSRVISVATGSTTYSFAIMLAAFLVGIALGSWLHGLLPLRRTHESVQFGVVLVLIGLSSLLVSQLIPRLPEYAVRLNLRFYGGLMGVRVGTTLLLSFLVMLVPCVFMGVAFPLAGQARARLKDRYGESVGDLVGFNTIGAIVGSLLAGFVLIPLLGLQRGMMLASGAYLGYGLIVLWVMFGSRRPRLRWPAAGAAVASIVLIGAAFRLAPPWNMRLFAAFQNNNTSQIVDREGRLDIDQWLDRTRLLYYRQGRGSTVAVIDTDAQRALLINGKSVATDNLSDMHHEYLLGHLPTLLHPDPKSAAVIGLGAGLTLGGVAAEESIERVVVVEIELAVFDAAALFADLHDDALNDPRVEVVYQDGRNYLSTTREKFDVITADPIHPWAQGAAYLYTTEYYRMIGERLTEGGVMCQWLPLYELSVDNLKSVVASFTANFGHNSLWQAGSDAVLIGSDAPLEVDLENLHRRMQQPAVARQLSRIGLADPLSLVAEYTMGQKELEDFAKGAVINTDDNLYLEFSSPLTIGRGVRGRNTLLIDSLRRSPAAVVGGFRPLFESRQEAVRVMGLYRSAKSATIQVSIEEIMAAAMQSDSGWTAIIERLRRTLEGAPDYGRARHLLAAALGQLADRRFRAGDDEGAIELLHAALDADAQDVYANFHLGTRLLNQGAVEPALPFLERALVRKPYSPKVKQNLGMALTVLGRFDEAARQMLDALRMRPEFTEIHHPLGFCLTQLGQFEEAIEQLEAARRVAPDRARVIQDLSAALSSAQRHRDAVVALREGLASNPGHAGLTLGLAWLLATSPDPTTRNGSEAVQLAEQIVRGRSDPQALDVLAAALAEAGRFGDAADTARRAAELAAAQGLGPFAEQVRRRLAAYEAGRPYRQ
ncbi:MAG: fused MFS/spermidine synthase [Planctomycetota bacterium]|jgi:spermidine synthase